MSENTPETPQWTAPQSTPAPPPQWTAAQWTPPPPQWAPPPPQQASGRRGKRRRALVAGVGALAIAGGAVGLGFAVTGGRTVAGTGELATGTTVLPRWGYGGGDSGNSTDPYGGYAGGGYGYGGGSGDGSGSGGSGGYGGSGSGSTGSTAGQQASAAQSIGVVDIDTVLGYENAEAAGTGTVVTSNGEVLTNNHVVDGATKITVTVVSTGKTYTAKVVGTDPTEDVAVLQLSNASGLQTAKYGDDDDLAVGQTVTGVGNAGGTGGTPSAATGKITALNRSITASDEDGGNAEKLTGLIETSAAIQAGDSGGPLYDSSGEIVGMDTAASTTGGGQTVAGYAIPIEHALAIAGQIESATTSTSTIHLGNPAFLGVSFASDAAGAPVYQVVEGTPAAQAGLVAGDVITRIGSTDVSSPAQVKSALAGYRPGQSVAVTWTDTSGQSHRARISLATGPAD